MISDFFIKRPIGTSLLAIGLAIAGIVAFDLLPVSSLPEIDFPTIQVKASLPGASPEIMASSVATPLEHQLGTIAGVTQITSSSAIGSTKIVLQFDLSRDINGAARDVQAAINAAESNLPTNLSSNPTYTKVNPADAPILILSVSSDINTRGQMYDLASSILAQKISQINGVGEVDVGGSSLPGIRIEANPLQLNQAGISFDAISNTIKNANVNLATGQLQANNQNAQIITNDQMTDVDQYRSLVVSYQNGNAVHLSDVANVIHSIENIRTAGFANGKPAVLLIIYKEPGANVVKTIDRINEKLPELQTLIPGTMHLQIMVDRTETIRASLHDVELTLIAAIILVILVVYAFLGNMRAMIIPGAAVILSLLGTFAIMMLCGYSLDNLSLMALTISTGFVIDDAIVVLENISRHVEEGLPPLEAAFKGAREVGFTVIAMSLSLIAVFTPLILMGGLIGRLFREFSITLSTAILVSLLVSLTVTPMMCAYFLFREKQLHKTNSPNRYQQLFTRLHEHYAKTLAWALDHQKLMLRVTLGAIALNLFLFWLVPKGFFPQQDTGRIIGSMVADQHISFQAMQDKLIRFLKIVQEDPNVKNVVGHIGASATNQGTVFVGLKPQSERQLSADQVINELRKKLTQVKGATLYLQVAQDLTIGGKLTSSQYQYTISGNSLGEVNTWAPKIMENLLKISGITDLNSDQQSHGLQVYVNVDRDRASQLGVTSQAVDNALYDAFGQNQISTMYSPLNQYHVVLEAAPPFWQDPSILPLIYAPSSSGQLIPLSAFASFLPGASLLSVNHQGLLPAATLSFNLLPNTALGDAVKKIETMVAKMQIPATVHANFSGTAEAFKASLKNQPLLILAALLAVYIVLGILYESWIHPVTILSTLPSAGIGALIALLLTHTDLSLIAFIGVILLIGIVKKNAIMMIDVALTLERSQNLSSKEAIYQAALLRFRPIMMTTAAALLGALPLALGFGVGAELRRPLGIAIIGGLVVSQILTLYTTPVVYLYFDKKR